MFSTSVLRLVGGLLMTAGLAGMTALMVDAPAATTTPIPTPVVVAAAPDDPEKPADAPAATPEVVGSKHHLPEIVVGSDLESIVKTAGSVVMILLGGIFLAAKTIMSFFAKAWKSQMHELNTMLDRKDVALKDIAKQNEDQLTLILQLRRDMASGASCPYLQADGCTRRVVTTPAKEAST